MKRIWSIALFSMLFSLTLVVFHLVPIAQEHPPMSVQAGTHFSMALLDDGSVWVWGANFMGELGLGDTNTRIRPTENTNLEKNPVQILAAVKQLGAATGALYADGTAVAWGGILLQPPPPNPARLFTRPLELPPVDNLIQIAISSTTIFGLTSDGQVWRWDWQGDETTPATRLGITDVTYISGPLALTSDGKVFDTLSNPPRLIFESEGIVKVAGSDQNPHYFALYVDGRVRAWGDNNADQLGLGPDAPNTIDVPRLIPNLFDIVEIVAAHEYTIALDADGHVWTWGSNHYGQLGDGTLASHDMPYMIPELENIISVSAGWEHSLAMNSSGDVFAWGNNKYGQLGVANSQCVGIPTCQERKPEPVVGLP